MTGPNVELYIDANHGCDTLSAIKLSKAVEQYDIVRTRVYLCVCLHACACVHIQMCGCVRFHVCMSACLCACVRSFVRACVRAHVHACVRACVRAGVRACLPVLPMIAVVKKNMRVRTCQ